MSNIHITIHSNTKGDRMAKLHFKFRNKLNILNSEISYESSDNLCYPKQYVAHQLKS